MKVRLVVNDKLLNWLRGKIIVCPRDRETFAERANNFYRPACAKISLEPIIDYCSATSSLIVPSSNPGLAQCSATRIILAPGTVIIELVIAPPLVETGRDDFAPRSFVYQFSK